MEVVYKIRVPKFMGNVIPLNSVAVAMATARATAFYSDDFHEPVYSGAYQKCRETVLSAAAGGTLDLCDETGLSIRQEDALTQPRRQLITRFVTPPDWEALQRQHPEAKTDLGWDWTKVNPPIDFGPSEIDEPASLAINLITRLDLLNAWAEKYLGARFIIDEDAPTWHDERGERGEACTGSNATGNQKPPEFILKRAAIVAELESIWPSIERDLRDASRSGLSDVAKHHDHGYWTVEPAINWAIEQGKIKKNKAESFAKSNPDSRLSPMLKSLLQLD